jgi:hypothetical protein
MVLAQKDRTVELVDSFPQQSDYELRWAIERSLLEGAPVEGEGRLKSLYRRHAPRWARALLHRTIGLAAPRKTLNTDLGVIDAQHFRKINLPGSPQTH